MSAPTREEAFEAFCTLLAYASGQGAPTVYDQRDGHRPADAKSADQFKRRHRQLRKAGIAGVWVRGKLLCCTAEAWASDLPKAKRPRLTVVETPKASVDDEIDRQLGIRTRATGR